MSDPNVPPGDMPTPPLDPDTADRLLAGSIPPDDAPDGYGRVAALVAAARQPATIGERSEPPAGLAELITFGPPPAESPRRPRRRFAAVAVAATVLLGTSSAAAATNNLPAPVQRTVSSLGSHLGLSIPEPPAPAEPSRGSTDPVVEDEAPPVPDPDAVDERTPGLDGQPPVEPRPEIVEELIPEPPVTLPTQPAPVNPPIGGESCALGEMLTAAGVCVPADQVETPGDPEPELAPQPTTGVLPDDQLPDHHDATGSPR